MIVITEGKGVDHERGGVPTAVKADIIHDLPAGIAQNSPTNYCFLINVKIFEYYKMMRLQAARYGLAWKCILSSIVKVWR